MHVASDPIHIVCQRIFVFLLLSLGMDKTMGAGLRNDRIVGEGVSKLLIKIKINK